MVHSLVRVTYTGSGGSKEDERSEVSSALVAQGASGVDESTDTVGLESRASEGRTPGESSTGSLLGADELLLGVGGLSALVGLAEDGGEDGELNTVVESSAQGDSGGLDGGEYLYFAAHHRSRSQHPFFTFPLRIIEQAQPKTGGLPVSSSLVSSPEVMMSPFGETPPTSRPL
ncbi:hypothetical protein HG530_007526 [Fusarium avenaceum]|nr:hypothetical protein HG530_007526 [Fusarium avenaceum]